MKHWSSLFLSFAVLCAPARPAIAGPEWVRLRSPNFTLEGNVTERDLRAVARRFEQFREAMNRLLPNASLVTPTPLTVVVFAYDRDFKPVRPLYNGKPIDAVGYAQGSPVGTSIAICLEHGEQVYPVIYHEYGHLLINNAVPHLPVWANEGLAEYYKTFELSADGKKATVGMPLTALELSQFQGRALIPMSQLLSAGHDSALYNVSTDRSRFYAQSWALVHYLLLGSPARKGQFDRFLNRVAAGMPAAAAFTESIIDADKLEPELTQYVAQFSFGAMQFTFKDKVAGDRDFSAEKMSPAEIECALGHLLLRQQRYPEALARFSAALTLNPSLAAAHTGMGLVEFAQDRISQALPALRKGVEYGGDNVLAHYSLGLAMLRCTTAECDPQPQREEAAREEFLRTTELCPNFPDALSFLGYTEMTTGASLEAAEKHLTAAIKFIPGREDYRLHLAQVYIRTKQFEQAQALLGPIAASLEGTQRAQARDLLGRLADMKNADTASRTITSFGEPSAPSASRPESTLPNESRPPSGAGKRMPIYRKALDGERRTEGTLETIECGRNGFGIVVRDASGVHRFSAASLDAIEFITYRDDLKGRVACGAQPAGMKVYLTSRTPVSGSPPLPAGTEGIVVAVEYLPKDK